MLNKKCTTSHDLSSDIKPKGLVFIIRGPEGFKVFEGYLLNYLYFVIICKRGNAHLNDLDVVAVV